MCIGEKNNVRRKKKEKSEREKPNPLCKLHLQHPMRHEVGTKSSFVPLSLHHYAIVAVYICNK